ncbi:MAG: peptidoglycan binding protein CsiV [Colwellia sp.]
MKFKATFLLSLVTFFVASILLSTTHVGKINAAEIKPKKAPRWFEIEVILFNQLGDKKLLKEQFPDNVSLPKYNRYFELLSAHLQPDITSLKQQLPRCDITPDELIDFNKSLVELQNKSAPYYLSKTLTEIEHIPAEPGITEPNTAEPNTAELNLSLEQESLGSELSELEITELEITELETEKSLYEPEQEQQAFSQAIPVGLSSEEIALVEAANQQFPGDFSLDMPLENYHQYPTFFKKQLCLLPVDFFDKILTKEQLDSFDINAFPIEKMATTIKASGQRQQNSPYLISDKSLLLGDIITRLKWSKNFKPLLHLGWRQIGITRKKAKPVKVYAGEHLEHFYQQAVTRQETELAIATKQAQSLEHNSSIENNAFANIEHTASAELQQLNYMLTEIAEIDENNIEQIVNQLGQSSFQALTSDQATNTSKNIKEPLQPWFLDGFFKVHLDHYLYITADFNILNKTLAEQATQNLSSNKNVNDEVKLINFSQNRRVISGEIHYFDHPYIGMIVQIRRFDPTKPESEAVSQAIR